MASSVCPVRFIVLLDLNRARGGVEEVKIWQEGQFGRLGRVCSGECERETTVVRDMRAVSPPGCGGKMIEEDMTSFVTAQVLRRHRLLREGVCMIGIK